MYWKERKKIEMHRKKLGVGGRGAEREALLHIKRHHCAC